MRGPGRGGIFVEVEPGKLHEISPMEWRGYFEDLSMRVVANDDVGDMNISTVWIGLDHSHGDSEPLIYETMIFGGSLDGSQWRYTYRAQALAGHAVAMATAMALWNAREREEVT